MLGKLLSSIAICLFLVSPAFADAGGINWDVPVLHTVKAGYIMPALVDAPALPMAEKGVDCPSTETVGLLSTSHHCDMHISYALIVPITVFRPASLHPDRKQSPGPVKRGRGYAGDDGFVKYVQGLG